MIEKTVHYVLCPRRERAGKVTRLSRSCSQRVRWWWRVYKTVGSHALRDLITIDRDGTLVILEDAVRSHGQ